MVAQMMSGANQAGQQGDVQIGTDLSDPVAAANAAVQAALGFNVDGKDPIASAQDEKKEEIPKAQQLLRPVDYVNDEQKNYHNRLKMRLTALKYDEGMQAELGAEEIRKKLAKLQLPVQHEEAQKEKKEEKTAAEQEIEDARVLKEFSVFKAPPGWSANKKHETEKIKAFRTKMNLLVAKGCATLQELGVN